MARLAAIAMKSLRRDGPMATLEPLPAATRAELPDNAERCSRSNAMSLAE